MFGRSWFRYFTQVASKHKFRSVDHMLNCTTTQWDKISLEQHGNSIPIFAHQSLINLCDLGFKRDPIMVFEDLMNQHLFGNRFIINPTTNQPWDRSQSSFSQTTVFQITTVADLYFTFNQREYKRDPVVRQVVPPDLALANIIFSSNQTRLQIPLAHWNQLYQSIPQDWKEIIQAGNQDFNEGEFFATILEGGDLGDVYRYQDGLLHYYTQDHDSILTDAQMSGLPGTRVLESPVPYPTLNQLKRVHTSKTNSPNLILINFMLPHRADKDDLPFGGAIPGSYFYSKLPKLKLTSSGNATYRVLSKHWRSSFSVLHPRTQQFLVDSNHNQDGNELKQLVRAISNLQLPPSMRVMLHKIVNNALYMGVAAHDYQTHKKSVDHNSDILMSPVCIYSDHIFSQYFIPHHHIPNPMVPATYTWILWESPIARSVWASATYLLNRIGLNLTASSYHEVVWDLAANDVTNGDETEKLKCIVKQNITVFVLWTLYSSDKRINDLKQTNQLTDEKVDNWIKDVTTKFEKLVYDEIWLLLHHRREIALHMKILIDDRPLAAFNQREQVFERFKFTMIDHNKLTADQKEIYSLVWHDLVEFVNQSLVIPPFRREPP